MILSSRIEKGRLKTLSRTFWPKKSYSRSLRYIGKRLIRIRATPHALALGFAFGVFAAFSPALGFHFLIALALAWAFGGNIVAAAFGTAAANPLTFPVMIAGDFKLGQWVFGAAGQFPVSAHEIATKLSHLEFTSMWEPLVKPMLAGSLVLGLVFASLAYSLIYFAAKAYASKREVRYVQPKSEQL